MLEIYLNAPRGTGAEAGVAGKRVGTEQADGAGAGGARAGQDQIIAGSAGDSRVDCQDSAGGVIGGSQEGICTGCTQDERIGSAAGSDCNSAGPVNLRDAINRDVGVKGGVWCRADVFAEVSNTAVAPSRVIKWTA